MQTVNPWLRVLDGIKFHHTLKTRTDPAPRVWWKVTIISHTKWHQMTHKTHQISRKQQPNQLPACWLWGLVVLAWTFDGAPGLPKICATLASLLPWSKGFGLWQGLGRRANTSLEALNKTTKMIHPLQNMFEVKLKFIMIEIRSHVWSQHGQNFANFGHLVFWSTLRRLLLLNWFVEDTLVFETYGKLAHLNHLPRWMTVKDTKHFSQSKRWLFDASR